MKSSSTLLSESFKLSESLVSDEEGSYKGLELGALCTDVEDLKSIFSHPLVKGTWVDLGSGYGHTVLSYAETFKDRKAIGIERELPRVMASEKTARMLQLSCEFIRGDLLHEKIPSGDTFFLYFPQGHVLDRILFELSQRDDFTIVAIESHGDLFPRLRKENWLTEVDRIPLSSKRHDPFARLFCPNQNSRELNGLHSVSFLERHLLLREGDGLWWGESFGLSASGADYLLQYPPRTIQSRDVVKIVTSEELDPRVFFLSALRRLPDVLVDTSEKRHSGPIRKIIVSPGFSVEFPSGERVEWEKIKSIFQGSHLCYDSSSPLLSLPPVR